MQSCKVVEKGLEQALQAQNAPYVEVVVVLVVGKECVNKSKGARCSRMRERSGSDGLDIGETELGRVSVKDA